MLYLLLLQRTRCSTLAIRDPCVGSCRGRGREASLLLQARPAAITQGPEHPCSLFLGCVSSFFLWLCPGHTM